MGRKYKKEGIYVYVAFPGGSVVKNPPANAEDTGSIPGSERSPGEGNGYPLQYSCLVNSTDTGAWQSHKESDVTEELMLSQEEFYCLKKAC